MLSLSCVLPSLRLVVRNNSVFVTPLLAGIFLFLWLLCSLVKANQFVRKLATQPRPGGSSSSGSSSSAGELVAGVLYIATNAAVVGWLTSGQRLYRRFLLQPPEAPISVGCISSSVLDPAWHGMAGKNPRW
jgi:hypothetical protein